MKYLSQIALVLALAISVQAAIQADLVTGLDQQTGYTLPWYSGYLSITDGSNQYKAHYFFFPSQGDSTTDPVVLWLNGGPGCSSLLGASQEHGPWIFKPNSTEIIVNEWSWNKHASVIYLESPPGVGFSTTTKYAWNDEQVAEVNLQSLVKFFAGYPEYQKLDFYIAGESYAGIYVPTLAQAVLNYNKQVVTANSIRLKGFLVGNGCTDSTECNFASNVDPWMYNVFAAQGWFTPEQLEKFEKVCGSYITPDVSKLNSVSCLLAAQTQLSAVQKGVNVYNLQGTCYYQNLNSYGQKTWFNGINPPALETELEEELAKYKEYFEQYQLRELLHINDNYVQSAPACVDAIGPTTFFNTLSVKQALHVDTSVEWTMCNDKISTLYTRSKTGSIGLYPNLIKEGLRIWFYSGDVDGAVPTAGSLYWFNQLNQQQGYEELIPWRAWYQDGIQYGYQPGNRQNAGQFQQTEGLSIVTFKGCGHMVPQDNPSGAYELINSFLNGYPLPPY